MQQQNEKFKKLFYQNYQTLCNVAYQYVMDRFVAEDIVQETFIRFWENEKSDLPPKEVGYYLTRAVKNNCITHLRKEVQSVSLNEEVVLAHALYSEEETEVTTGEKLDMVEKAIQQLPPKCKEVFLLCKVEQKKYREIAQMLNISVKTVENHMTKAIAFLRSCVREKIILLLIIQTIILILVS